MQIKKKLALLLSAAMLVTSINVTSLSVQATTTDNGNATTPATASTKLSLHIHGNWTYETDGATLTAKCFDYDNCHESIALTLNASSANYSGSETGWCKADGIAFELNGETEWESTVGEAPTIHYTGTTADGTEYSSAVKPTEEGNYTASIECDKQKAELNFTVGHIFEGQPYVDAEDGTHHYQKCKYCDETSEQANHNFIAQEYQTDDAGKHYQICNDCGGESEHVACTSGEAVQENVVAPTCKAAGSHDDVVYCIVCNQKLSTTPVTDPAIKKHTLKTTITKATLTKNGRKETKCSVCNTVTKTQTIYAAKTVKLDKVVYTYDGKTKKPSVIIKDSKGKALAKSNYEISYPKKSKAVGKYTVKVTLKGDYKGSKSLSFVINPPKTSISKLTAKSKAFAVKWAKKTKEVTGYEIQYSKSSKFAKGNKTVKITPAKAASTTIKKLSGGKKYYVRIRTYKTVGKKKYYSDWSAKKSVTAKK